MTPATSARAQAARYIYGLSHCLTDRDGRVIGSNLPINNGPLLAQAPAKASLLRDLVSGAAHNALLERARAILHRIDKAGNVSHARTTNDAQRILNVELFDNLLQEFTSALDRAMVAHIRNRSSRAAVEELHYADDIYDTIAEEIRRLELREPIEGVPPLVDLYARLKAAEKIIVPPRM